MRTLIIGDVHGCLRELELLLKKANYDVHRDELIFVGDLINKGPHSLSVLEYVKNLRAKVILGNHELALLIARETGQKPRYPREIVNWIRSWPVYIETKDFIVVHGGIIPGEDITDSHPRMLTRIRNWDDKKKCLGTSQDPPWYDFYHGDKLVIFGHWAAKGLVWRDNAIGLDTGCVYGRKLSCLVMPGRQLVQIDALDVYEEVTI